jgi:predicted hydrocarbon binding protein
MIDANNIDLKKEVVRLNALPGQERGIDYNNMYRVIKAIKGEEGIQEIRKALKEISFEIPDDKKYNDYTYIPEGLSWILYIAAVKVFNWSENDIKELGGKLVLSSPMLRILIKYFLSMEKTIRRAVTTWKKKSTTSTVKLVEFDKKKRKMTLKLTNYNRHSTVCYLLMNSFAKIVELASGSKKVEAKETKCAFRGDSYHEFQITW